MKITEMTVSSLVSAIESGELSSREITDAYLERIDETDGELNAYITVCHDKARQAADSADRENLPAVKRIPYALKDNIAVSGVKMTCASHILDGFIPDYTATVAAKLGGIILGKTNLDEFAMGSSCEKSYYGATKNPHSYEFSPGGSSGGSAAAVAAFSAPWAVGTDTGGSARQPSAFCGTVAMKPTYGLVSRFGVAELASSMDTVCPITRNVYDNALMLDIMSGFDKRDMTSLAGESHMGEFTSAVREGKYCCGLGGVRIGVPDCVRELCDEGVISAFDRAVMLLDGLKTGAELDSVRIPSGESMLGCYLVVSQAECSSNMSRYDGLKYGFPADGADYREIMKNTRSEGFGAEVKRRILSGCYALSEDYGGAYYSRASRLRENIINEFDKIFSHFDVIVLPAASTFAMKIGEYDKDPTKLYSSDIFTVGANLTGYPSITIPCGGNGTLPCGIQLMGRKNSEKLLYKAAAILESSLGEYVKSEVSEIE